MPKSHPTPAHAEFMRKVGSDLRAMRESSGQSLEEIANLLFDYNRDALSKIETGKTNVSLYNYLRIIDLLYHTKPDHPAVTLVKRYKPDR